MKKAKEKKEKAKEMKKQSFEEMKEEYMLNRAAIKVVVQTRVDLQEMRERIDGRLGLKKNGKKIERTDVQGMRAMPEEEQDELLEMRADIFKREEACKKMLAKLLETMPIYTEYLKHIPTVAEIPAAWICSEFDIFKAENVSKMWQYAGLNSDKVRGKKKGEKRKDGSHPIIVTDTWIRGDKQTKGFLSPYNKKLRTALLGILGELLIKGTRPKGHKRVKGVKVKNTPTKYKLEYYEPMKYRLEHSEKKVMHGKGNGKKEMVPWKDVNPKHRHEAARRYMVKMFLLDLYKAWRPMYGLEVKAPFMEWKLGMTHHASPANEIDMLDIPAKGEVGEQPTA